MPFTAKTLPVTTWESARREKKNRRSSLCTVGQGLYQAQTATSVATRAWSPMLQAIKLGFGDNDMTVRPGVCAVRLRLKTWMPKAEAVDKTLAVPPGGLRGARAKPHTATSLRQTQRTIPLFPRRIGWRGKKKKKEAQRPDIKKHPVLYTPDALVKAGSESTETAVRRRLTLFAGCRCALLYMAEERLPKRSGCLRELSWSGGKGCTEGHEQQEESMGKEEWMGVCKKRGTCVQDFGKNKNRRMARSSTEKPAEGADCRRFEKRSRALHAGMT